MRALVLSRVSWLDIRSICRCSFHSAIYEFQQGKKHARGRVEDFLVGCHGQNSSPMKKSWNIRMNHFLYLMINFWCTSKKCLYIVNEPNFVKYYLLLDNKKFKKTCFIKFYSKMPSFWAIRVFIEWDFKCRNFLLGHWLLRETCFSLGPRQRICIN